jgi:hypothetical protein
MPVLIKISPFYFNSDFLCRHYLEQFPEIMRKRKRGQGAQGKVEDAGGLTPVKDNNAALRFLGR